MTEPACFHSGCFYNFWRKRSVNRIDKQTWTKWDSKRPASEIPAQSVIPFGSNRIVLRGTFSLENQPDTKPNLGRVCSTNPGMTSSMMTQPSNINEQIQTPYISSLESSLRSDDLIAFPTHANPSTMNQSVQSTIDDQLGSQGLGDDGLAHPISWRPIKSQEVPPSVRSQQSDSIPPSQGCHCHVGCVNTFGKVTNEKFQSSTPFVHPPKQVPQMAPTRAEQTTQIGGVLPFSSYRLMLFPDNHVDACHFHPQNQRRPASAGAYLIEYGPTAIPVHIRTDPPTIGSPRSGCRCQTSPCCHIRQNATRNAEPDYITMTISPTPTKQQGTNQHHNSSHPATPRKPIVYYYAEKWSYQ